MGILKKFKDKFSKKPKVEILSDREIANLSIEYSNEVKLLSHAVDVSKPEDKAFFSTRADKYIQTYSKLLDDIALAKAYAEIEVEDFLETGDDILAHNTQEYYDELLAEWKAAPILIEMAEARIKASYTALCQLKAYFENAQEYDSELVEKIAKDSTTIGEMKRKAMWNAKTEVAAMETINPFNLSKETLSSIGRGAAIGTMVGGVLTGNIPLTAAGATAYHLNKKIDEDNLQK